MTKVENPPAVRRRGRIFPEIQWSPEKKARWRSEQVAFRKRCQVIFERVKPNLLETHYNWYMVVEPNSEEYFIAQDGEVATQMARQKYPNSKLYLFRISETGVCGTI
ncbi:MAG: hypothetical protein F6K47_02225 [Symploca sp. SIO2E6]|nr:hypothetical protein [Symploca sp. SIO2E6]